MHDCAVQVGELLRWDGVPPMYAFDDLDGNRFYVWRTPDDRLDAPRVPGKELVHGAR